MPPYRNSLTPEEIKLEYQKRKARNILTTALAKGEIQRLPCAVCGSPQSEGHHDDYFKPLEIRWFCHSHHMAEHKRIRAHGNV